MADDLPEARGVAMRTLNIPAVAGARAVDAGYGLYLLTENTTTPET
jgi:hypothetical protein